MKLLKRNISAKDGSGSVLLRPETPEDLWHAYNLLQVGDLVRCTTLRKVVKETSTGSTSSSKKRLSLTIQVDKVDFDPDSLQVRLSGPTQSESQHVRMGAYHTLTLELAQNFSIEKPCWDEIFLDIIEQATQPEQQAEVAAMVLQTGLAHLCLVTGSITVTKARIDVTIPKKRTGSSNHTKAIQKFYEACYQAILRHVDFTKIKVLVLASPGYVKDDFYKYCMTESVKREDRSIMENKQKFLLTKASSGHKHALEEVFADDAVMGQIADTKLVKEVAVLNKFMRMMDTHPDKAYYGYLHVSKANEEQAIDSLLVTDELFRNSNIATRKKYVQLVESVRENGGHVYIFSSMHVSGKQLQQVSGVAAILRYPLPDLDELEQVAALEEEDVESYVSSSDDSNQAERRVQEDLQDMGF